MSSKFWNKLLSPINALIWPRVCLNCGEKICEDEKLCNKCWMSILNNTSGDYCPSCGLDVSRFALIDNHCAHCHRSEIKFDGIARVGIYGGVLRSLIMKFKLGDKLEYEEILCFMLRSALAGQFFADDIDLLVPVPIHWTRRIKRGYNQSKLLAKGISFEGVHLSNELVRVKKTKLQPGLSTAGRKRNVSGAFALRKGADFVGKSVCLVDDIKTSGATLNECASVLKKAGAEKVYALVLAVAGQDNEVN